MSNRVIIKDEFSDHVEVHGSPAEDGLGCVVLVCYEEGMGEQARYVFSYKQAKQLRKALKKAGKK